MDFEIGYVQAYLSGLFDDGSDETSNSEPDPEDFKKYFGETAEISTFIDNNSIHLYKCLDDLINRTYESIRPWTSFEVRMMILKKVSTDKLKMICKLFYKELGFHPDMGPNDGALHFAVFKMIQLYLEVYQKPNNTSFRPLHLAIDIVLRHQNQLPSERFSSLGSSPAGGFGRDSSDFKFHAAVKMTNYLLENGADPNEPDENGKMPLYRIVDHLKRFLTWELASTDDSSYMTAHLLFILFLRHGADVNPDCDNPENDPFWIGLGYCCRTVVQLLIEHGYDLKKCSKKISPPRSCISWFGLFELLVRADVFDLEAKDKGDGQTLLMIVLNHAVSKSLFGEVEALVQNGSDVNAVAKGGISVLAKAASIMLRRPNFDKQTYTKILRLLISHGAKVWDEFEPWIQQPIRDVLSAGPWEAVELFLDESSDNHFTLDGLRSLNPLPTAAGNKNREVFEKLLLEYQCDFNIKNKLGDTTLHLTIGWDSDEDEGQDISAQKHYVDLLVARGADINFFNQCHETPLYYAVQRNHEMVQHLLLKGANINVKNEDEELPLDIAINWGKGAAARVIVAHIALLEYQNLKVDPQNYNLLGYRYNLREYHEKCKTELKLAKKSSLHGSITYYHLLVAKNTCMRHYARLEPLQELLQSQNLQNRFPIYGNIMNQRFAEARREVELLPGAITGLSRILKLSTSAFHIVYNNIASNLCELDLSNLGKI